MIPASVSIDQIVLFALFVAAALLLRRFLRASWLKRQGWRTRVLREDLLKQVARCELDGLPATLESLAGGMAIGTDDVAELVGGLSEAGLLRLSEGKIQLSPAGRSSAMHLIRAHRLWERHLAETSGFDEREWHRLAELREHELTPAETDALSASLGYPTHDPHGDPIPTAEGALMAQGGQPLTDFEAPRALRIQHVEDEPETVYAQLVAEGLAAGMEAQLIERTDERLRLWTEAGEHLLAPVVAANLHVVPVASADAPTSEGLRLSDLGLGERARVSRIGPRCRGAERRRIMDLGLLPGTTVTAELRSAGGDPIAYRLRGALIALRKAQAENIFVIPIEAREEIDAPLA